MSSSTCSLVPLFKLASVHLCVCARVCVCVCMFMWLEDTYVYNDMGITQVLQGDGDLFFGHFQCPHN